MRAFTHDDRGTSRREWDDLLETAALPLLDLSPYRRLVVVGAHPDDESLGAGGLLVTGAALGLVTALVVATDGEGSHPGSPTHDPAALARRRRAELGDALAAVGQGGATVITLGLPDGRVGDHADEVVASIVDVVGDGRDCLVVAPYRGDGHPDHEAMGSAAAAAAHRTGATLAEYPIWLWHAGGEHDLPLRSTVRLPLTARTRAGKQAAIACHTSQIRPLSDQPGDAVMLPEAVLEHFAGTDELFVLTPAEQTRNDRLDRLHRDDDDPWGAESRWYEQRKRSLLLAALPRPRFTRALEVGCSTAVLTEALQERAARVVAIDSSLAALDLARRRLGDHADLREVDVPWRWPEGSFDLVVVSEVGYFLSPVALEGLVGRVADSLTPDGVVVLCHWRHPVKGWPLDGEDVHRAFASAGIPERAATYRDRDIEIVVHTAPEQWPDPHR